MLMLVRQLCDHAAVVSKGTTDRRTSLVAGWPSSVMEVMEMRVANGEEATHVAAQSAVAAGWEIK